MSEIHGEYEEARLPQHTGEEPPLPPPLPPPRRTPPQRHFANPAKRNSPNQQPAAPANPARRNSPTPTTIVRFSAIQPSDPSCLNITTPRTVAIGPYHHGSPHLSTMEAAKLDALVEFCRVAGQTREAVRGNILHFAGTIRNCYDIGDKKLRSINDDDLSEMMLRDGCFVLQFMNKMVVPMWPNDSLMSREDVVYTRMDTIARDILLLENQIPWFVIQLLMKLGKVLDSKMVVSKFLDHMATAFDVSTQPSSASRTSCWSNGEEDDKKEGNVKMDEEEGMEVPRHFLGLFHRHLVGKSSTQQRDCLSLPPSLGNSALEHLNLARIGIKLTASKTNKFGYMEMKKHRRPLGLFGKLSVAPVALKEELTTCWLLSMVAYETQAGCFAVSSYVFLVAQLLHREEDVQYLRARGIISSTMSDLETFYFFKLATANLRVGNHYIQISQRIKEYKQERWIWIAIHSFLYDNIKIIVAVLSVVGVLAGLFKTFLSQPQR